LAAVRGPRRWLAGSSRISPHDGALEDFEVEALRMLSATFVRRRRLDQHLEELELFHRPKPYSAR